MSQNNPMLDYLAPDVSELAAQRGPVGNRQRVDLNAPENQITRTVARRLLPACVVVPSILWWILALGVGHWYTLETCCILFVYSVTVVFGIIVCLNLKKISRLAGLQAQAQEQLKFAKDAAESANRFKSAFFANISHEIRTPLTAINGFAELVLNPDRTSDQRLADARVIRRNGEHLLTLINDILDLSKIEAGKMSVDRISCCPAQIIGECVSMLRQRATEKGLKLDVAFQGSIPQSIRTDPTRLRQVLINLIANAIKFTKEGSVDLAVSIQPKYHAENPLLEMKITDTGIGISPDQQAALFKPFAQGDATISRQYGGSGLGLAISQHFARALGGDVAVTSQQGRGSTFTVTIATDVLAGVSIQDNPQGAMEAKENFNAPKVRITGSILVAEDGIDNQALIAAKLRETGLKLELAPNGQIAFDKAMSALNSDKPYDLILMDVQMPVMDGFTATQQLRGKGYRGPIIALTANAMERDRNKCLSAGCNDFVTKPINMEKLFKAIGRYLKVTPVAKASSLIQSAVPAAATPAVPTATAEKFYQDLPAELAQLEQAVERQDRVQLKEVAQLILGKAATAGLKEIAPQAAKLLLSAESEQSWINLNLVVSQFTADTQSQAKAA